MELREILTLPHRITGGLTPARLVLRRAFVRLARRYPHASTALTAVAACGGYVLLLVFPYLVYSMPRAVYESALVATTPKDWLLCGAQVTSLALGAIVTLALLRLRFGPPAGRPLSRQEAPGLYRVLAELHGAYGRPAIHRVLLDDGEDVRIVHTPRGGLSPCAHRSLVIGLPVLQTASPDHMRVLLARRVGELAWRNRGLVTWLHHLNDVWRHYEALRDRPSAPVRLIGLLFSAYAPVYRMVSSGTSRRAELHADSCVLDIINDQEAVEAISFHAASRDFLTRRYWPTIERLVAQDAGTGGILPFRHLGEVARKGLSNDGLDQALRRLHDNGDDPMDDTPGFAERLENVGYASPPPLRETASAAAGEFIGPSLSSIVGWFDERWLAGLKKAARDRGSIQ